MLYTFSEEKVQTAMKLVTVGEEERIVGCHIIGDGADEMLQGFAVAIRMGATKQQNLSPCAEGIVTNGIPTPTIRIAGHHFPAIECTGGHCA